MNWPQFFRLATLGVAAVTVRHAAATKFAWVRSKLKGKAVGGPVESTASKRSNAGSCTSGQPKSAAHGTGTPPVSRPTGQGPPPHKSGNDKRHRPRY